MREPRLRSNPSTFHPSTNRRMYRFASSGEIGDPCGMPRRLSRAAVVRVFRPRSSVSSTGLSSHILIRCSTRRSTIRRDVVAKALGVERIIGQKVEPLALHLATAAAVEPSHLQFEENARVAARQVAHPADLAVVPTHLDVAATAAGRFFERRLSVITRAFGSPKMPRTVGAGRKPGKQYASHSRRVR